MGGDNDGHRSRLRRRFLNSGKEGFCEHELLELLLCYAIPRKDVKPLAKELIRRFGSVQAVLAVPCEQLSQTCGIGESAVVLMKLVTVMGVEIMSKPMKAGICLREPEKLKAYLMAHCRRYRKEKMLILLLDSQYRLLDKLEIDGYSECVSLNISDTMFKILSCPNTRNVIIAHRHPGNSLIPSRDDINSTVRLQRQMQMADITLLDHFLISDFDCVSMMKASLCEPRGK